MANKEKFNIIYKHFAKPIADVNYPQAEDLVVSSHKRL